MPPRKRAVGVRPPDDPNNTHLAAPHEGVNAEDLTAETERVLAELGENISNVVVYRMKDNKPGEYDFVARVAATEFTPDYVKEQFGGGDYRVVIIDSVQGPLNPVFFSVDRRFVGKVWGSMSPAAVVAQGTGDPFRDEMMKILLAKALTPPVPQSTTKDTIELVLAVVAAMKGGGDSSNVMEQVTAMISTATTLAQAMNPPEGLAGVAGSFLPLMERLVPPRAARATHQIAAPARVATTTTQTPADVKPSNEVQAPARVAGTIVPKWLTPFRSLVPMLVRFADRGSDPVLYAEMALDEMQENEELFKAAVEAMNEARLTTDLFAVAPDLQATEKRKEFAAALVTRITEGLQEIIAAAEDETDDVSGDDAAHG